MSFTVQCIATGEVAIVDSMAGHDDPTVWRVVDATPPAGDAPMVLDASGNAFVPAPPPPPTRIEALIALLVTKGVLTSADAAELPQ